MSKYSANGEDADIKDILESIWKMASDERNAIAVSNNGGGAHGPAKINISHTSKPDSVGSLNGSRLKGSMVTRPLVDMKRASGTTSSLLVSGQLLPFTKPIRHVRSTVKASESQQLSEIKLGAEAQSKPSSPQSGLLNYGQSPPPLSAATQDSPQQAGSNSGASPQTSKGSKTNPAPSATPSGADEPKRVMAPFLDTKLNRMGGLSSPNPPQTAKTAAPVSEPTPEPAAEIEPPRALQALNVPATIDVRGQTPTAQITSTTGPDERADLSSSSSQKPVGTAHDAAAEMLRPVLRQWLGENMPRIVETALQIEVAESLQKDTQDSGES